MCCSPFFHLPAIKQETQFSLSEPAPTLRTMQIWHTATAVFFILIFMLAALSYIGGPQNRQKRQGCLLSAAAGVGPALWSLSASDYEIWRAQR